MHRKHVVIAAVVAVMAASPLHAQVRVGRDSLTRLERFGRDLAYGTLMGFGYAGIDQATNSPSEWGHGWNGYGKRLASNLGEFYIQEGVTEGLAALMNRPLDYGHCSCHDTGGRVAWAVEGAVLDELPDGHRAFAVPRIVGAYAGAIAQASWRPDTGDRWRVGLTNGTTSLAIGALINLYHEFHHDVGIR